MAIQHFSNQVTSERQVFMGFPKNKPNGISIVSVGFEKCLPDFLVERDSYPEVGKCNSDIIFTTVEFIISGEGKLQLVNSNYKLHSGCLFSYKVDKYHKISCSPEKPMVKYFIVLAHAPHFEIESEIIRSHSNFQTLRQHDEIIELFELILGNANLSSEHGVSICNLLAQTIILKISDLTKLSTGKQVRAWDTYNRIHQHLRKNYFRIKTIEELGTELNIDPAYLSRVFKRFHNETPYRFLIRLKMGHAASLLLSSRRLIKDIAFELGFENPFHFSRTFKSVYRVSPENFI
jgi:AraC-like DNA-binding protein